VDSGRESRIVSGLHETRALLASPASQQRAKRWSSADTIPVRLEECNGRWFSEAAPTADQTGAFWDDCKTFTQPLIDAKIVKKNETERSLEMPNGGRIRAKTAWDAATRPGDYVAVLAYVTPDKTRTGALQALRRRVGELTGRATTLGFGPRFLHSTGQLHKGGAGNGVFLQITAADATDAVVPGAGYGFATLKMAQALGDFQSLREHGRRAVRIHLSKNATRDLAAIVGKLKAAVPAA
jgi:hypothetical protein